MTSRFGRAVRSCRGTLLSLPCQIALGLGIASGVGSASMLPAELQCEYRVEPLGVDSPGPRLGWVLRPVDPAARGLTQTAYRILVASSPELLGKDRGDLWDSGKVASDRTNAVAYAGKPLRSNQAVVWKVRVWDGADTPCPWSAPASWTAGVFGPADWHAKWISAPESLKGNDNSTVLVRHEFAAKPGLKRATVNVCGLGQYEMTLNGGNVTKDVFTPGWTEYTKTCLYDTYDVTGLLREGKNAVGLLLGNGMYRVAKGGRYAKFQRSFGRLQAIAQIHLEYSDGTTDVVGTDERWRAGPSPMTFSSVYGGEDWDARLEQKGWDRADFDGSKWSPVDTLAGPGGALKGVGRGAPPVRAFEVHRPVGEKSVKPNVAIYDLGQNASHVTRFTVSGPAGSAVRVTPSELLTETGVLFRNNYNGRAFSQYTLTGTGKETYTAKFYYCGCRYLQVECLPADGGSEAPRVDAIEGVVVHSDAPQTGQFSCSNDLFNRIFAMIRWAELSNMMSVISDCPHRERLGWLEQDHLHGPSFRYNYDMTPTFAKIIGDVADCQLESGLVPTTAPEYPTFSAKWRDAIEWGSSGVLLPWQQYQWTGDLDELRRSYPMMKRYVGYLTGRAKGGISAPGLGDWVGNGPSKATPNDLIATALYYHDADVLARVARLLGHADDAEATERLAAGIKAAFNAAYFRPETGQYGTGSQCANAMALALGLAAPADRPAVLKNLVTDLETRRYELTVGEVGMQYMLRALADGGRSDVVFALANQSDKPGYGYMLKMGATALCECWDAARDNSQNQFMHGHIVEWYYHDLAGIQSDPEVAGSKQVAIRPNVVGDLTEVKGRCNTARGVVASEWRRDGRSLKMRVVIPPNMMATVRVPAEKNTPVTEGGKPAAEAAGVKQVVATGTYAEYHIGSGEYEFQSRLP